MPTLKWIGKDAVIDHDRKVPFRLLRKIKSASADDSSQNLIIHGDNLEALKALMPYYVGKIKCIYIDPPYNTGNEKWIYNDRVNSPEIKQWLKKTVNNDDLTRHDKWLCMMYPRLSLLKNLLSEDGAVFVSIDDNEHCNLKQIMDEIFGDDNFVGTFIVNTTPNARDYGHIGKMHEFCLFYAKDYGKLTTNLLEDKEKNFKYLDEVGGFNIHPLYNSNVAFTNENRPNLYYPFYVYKDKPVKELGENFYEISLISGKNTVEVYPPKSVKEKAQFVWRWGREKAAREINKEIIGYRNGDGEYKIVQKMRNQQKLIRSILLEKDYTSRRGTRQVEELFGVKTFVFPKPIDLIKTFLKAATDDDSIILDSFAGSGTTGHAVLDLNKEDGGDRKFILVEMGNEVAKDIAAERVKRAIKKYDYKAGFEYCELSKPLFNEKGQIEDTCDFKQLATYIYFTETQTNIDPAKVSANFIGEYGGTEYYLIYKEKGANVIINSFLQKLRKNDSRKVIYADKCMLNNATLGKHNAVFKQIPYKVKVY